MSQSIYRSTINLNDDSAQVAYEHAGMEVFTPTCIVVRKGTGGIPAEGATATLFVDDTGSALLKLEIPTDQLNESNAVLEFHLTRVSQLSSGQAIRVKPDVAYGDTCTVLVDVIGY